jgi:hypothetical protein
MISGCDTCAQTWSDLQAVEGLLKTRLCPTCARTVTWVESDEAEQAHRLQGLTIFRSPAYELQVQFRNRPYSSTPHPYYPISELTIPAATASLLQEGGVYYIADLALRKPSELRLMGIDDHGVLEIDLALRAKGFVLGAWL